MTNKGHSECQKNLKQYYSLLTAFSDFRQAQRIATRILEGGLHLQAPENRVLWEALNCAMIVAYCRPFVSGKRRRSTYGSPLPGHFLKDLSQKERSLHGIVLEERNRLLAHSDVEARGYAPEVWTIDDEQIVTPWSRDVRAPLIDDAVRMLCAMCQKIMDKVMQERLRVEPEVRKYFPKVDVRAMVQEHNEIKRAGSLTKGKSKSGSN